MSDILATLGWATIGALCGVTGGWLMFCYPGWLARLHSGEMRDEDCPTTETDGAA
jgi:hypothetical protein